MTNQPATGHVADGFFSHLLQDAPYDTMMQAQMVGMMHAAQADVAQKAAQANRDTMLLAEMLRRMTPEEYAAWNAEQNRLIAQAEQDRLAAEAKRRADNSDAWVGFFALAFLALIIFGIVHLF